MQTYTNWDIQEMPLSSPFFHGKVERFLAANGLRLEEVDVYLAVLDTDGSLLAGGGLSKDIIKCIAVAPEVRSEGLASPLVSRLIAEASARGRHNLKVFTKPENQAIFQSLGFRLLAQAPKAILMENGRGLERYCAYLRSFRRPGRSGVVVMNANPFTLGHQYLIEKASRQVDTLFVIPVKEDVSIFPYAERLAMIRAGIAASPAPASSVVVLEGSDYVISGATFPTYFLKDLSEAAETQMQLDLDLYRRWIAPALDVTVRFVGSEPFDALTARYNTLIPDSVEISRLHLTSEGSEASEKRLEVYSASAINLADAPAEHGSGSIVSASKVRKALTEGSFVRASALCPETTHPYLLAVLAERALRKELELPLKPGLVCPDSTGAHRDMDYALMLKGIASIRPYFPRMVMAASADELRQLGIDAEAAMMAATGGVNTHRGAIFALGLALNSVCALWGRRTETPITENVMHSFLCQNAQELLRSTLSDSNIHSTLVGARRVAADGYKELFDDWLPYYRSVLRGKEVFSSAKKYADATEKTSFPLQNADATEKPLQATLLRIMSTLDDTCVVKRVGPERAEAVKREAAALLAEMPDGEGKDATAAAEACASWRRQLAALGERYAAEGISPGGAADMLALTIFIHSIIL